MKKELAEFQEDTYLYDLLESEEIEGILNIEHFWIDKLKGNFYFNFKYLFEYEGFIFI